MSRLWSQASTTSLYFVAAWRKIASNLSTFEFLFTYIGEDQMFIVLFYFMSFFFSPTFLFSSIAENFKYSELQIDDYDKMLERIKKRITDAKKILIDLQDKKMDEDGDHQATEVLRNTLKLILSRPNDDNMLAKLLPLVRSELNNLNAFEDTLISIVQESLRMINNDKLDLVYRSTAVFILENVMSEFKPEISTKADIKKVFTLISEAQLKIPDPVKNERSLRSMHRTLNPSEQAKLILNSIPPPPSTEQKAKPKTSS